MARIHIKTNLRKGERKRGLKTCAIDRGFMSEAFIECYTYLGRVALGTIMILPFSIILFPTSFFFTKTVKAFG